MSRKKTVTLYFTEEANLTDAQASELERTPGARHRNAAMIDPEAPLEACDYVSGPAIPDSYAHLPVAQALGEAEEDEDGGATEDPNEMSVAELKAALTGANVAIPATAKKAALVALYQEHLGEGE